MNENKLLFTIFLIAMVSIGWGVAFLSLAILLQYMAPMQVLAARWGITALLFLCLILAGKVRIDLKSKRPVLANTMGGFSGPAVFPVALRAVWQVTRAVSIPVIGCGGIASAEDVLEMMMAGAAAVQIGSANLVDPYACKKIIEALPETMEKYGIKDLKEICNG